MTPREAALGILARYYAASNSGDRETFFGLVTDGIVHDLNQGG